MSKRMQVLVPEAEYERIRRIAESSGLTLAEWVRQKLRDACNAQACGDANAKLAAIRRAAKHRFPTADIGQMLAEIDEGRRGNEQS